MLRIVQYLIVDIDRMASGGAAAVAFPPRFSAADNYPIECSAKQGSEMQCAWNIASRRAVNSSECGVIG